MLIERGRGTRSPLSVSWTRQSGGYTWIPYYEDWVLVASRPGDQVFTLHPMHAMIEFVRLSRLEEVSKTPGLRKHIIRFADRYGWLGLELVDSDGYAGESLAGWVLELRLASRWWLASRRITHCLMRFRCIQPLDAYVLELVRSDFSLRPESPALEAVEEARTELRRELVARMGALPRSAVGPMPASLLSIVYTCLVDHISEALSGRQPHEAPSLLRQPQSE